MIDQIQPFFRTGKQLSVKFQAGQIIRRRPVIIVQQAVDLQKLRLEILKRFVISGYGTDFLHGSSDSVSRAAVLITA